MTLPPDFILRPMTPEDLRDVLQVEREAYAHPWQEEVFERELRNTWSNIALLVKVGEDSRPVAHVVYWIVHDELHLLNIAVHPMERGKGLGRVLMQHLFDVCETERIQYLTLEVRVSNAPAIGLYRAFGFQDIGCRKKYYADNQEDALVMALVLEEDKGDAATPTRA